MDQGAAASAPGLNRSIPSTPPTRQSTRIQIDSISLEDAKRVIAAGEAEAADVGRPSNIAVADAGGNLAAHVPMDGAWLGSVAISIDKAFTARAFDLPTADLAEQAAPGQQFYGIHVSNNGRVMIFAGGVP